MRRIFLKIYVGRLPTLQGKTSDEDLNRSYINTCAGSIPTQLAHGRVQEQYSA